MSYTEYLNSEDWAKKSATRLVTDGWKCVICGSQNSLNVHHLFYSGRWEDTPQEQLRTLCHDCHVLVHRINERFDKQKAGLKKTTTNGFLDDKNTAYETFCAEIHGLVTREIWTRNMFERRKYITFIRRLNKVLGDDASRPNFHLGVETVDRLLALVKDCIIANPQAVFDASKRKERAKMKTRYK